LSEDDQRIPFTEGLTEDGKADTVLEIPADLGGDFMKGEY